MPVSFNSPPRNFFLLGSGGEDAVTNFFHNISRTNPQENQHSVSDIAYTEVDQKYLLSGSAKDGNTTSYGWIEKRDYDSTVPSASQEWQNKFTSTTIGVNTTLNFMKQTLSYGGDIIVGGKTGNVPWIAKYNANGVQQWMSTSQSADVEYVSVACKDYCYYACGYSDVAGQDGSAFIEKWDDNGTPQWGKLSTRLGGDVKLNSIAANDRGEVVAVGEIDGEQTVGYVVKVDMSTGDILWDLTIDSGAYHTMSVGLRNPVTLNSVYVDGNDQIYIVGQEISTEGGIHSDGVIFKYTAEGNLIWHKRSAAGEQHIYSEVWSDTEVEQTIVLSHETVAGSPIKKGPTLIKYSKNGDVVFKRRIQSSTNTSQIKYGLDGDPSFYYILFVDEDDNVSTGASKTYNFGKVSASGNGFGEFTYDATNSKTITYSISSSADRLGRLSDGSVRNDSSDLISYPYSGLKTLFDDYATNIAYKKTRHPEKDVFLYSGSPAIRIADFQEMNLLGDVYSGSGDWLDQSGKGNDAITSVTTTTTSGGNTSSENYYDGGGLYPSTTTYSTYGTVVEDVTTTLPYSNSEWTHYGGKARDLQSGGFKITFSDNSAAQDFFMGCWVKFDTYQASRQMGINLFGDYVYWETLPNGNVAIRHNGGNRQDTTGGTGINDGNWHYISLSRNGGTLAGCVDGSAVITTTNGVSGNSVPANAEFWFFGGSGNAYNIDGKILDPIIAVNNGNAGGTLVPTKPLIDSSFNFNNGSNSSGPFALNPGWSYASPAISLGGGTATTTNGPTYNFAGYWDFDGTDDKIDVTDLRVEELGETFTAEAWIYPTTFAAASNTDAYPRRIMSCHKSNASTKWCLGIDTSGRVGFGGSAGAEEPNANKYQLSLNTWHHVMLVHDDTEYTLYVDGVARANNTSSPIAAENSTQDPFLCIGGRPNQPDRVYQGRIGDVRAYLKPLSAAQVFQNYNATKSKYITEGPDTAPRIGPDIVKDGNTILTYDFGNRASYDPVENLFKNSNLLQAAPTYVPNEYQSGIGGDLSAVFLSFPQLDGPFGTKDIKVVAHGSLNTSGGGLEQEITGLVPGIAYTASAYVRKISEEELAYWNANNPVGLTTGTSNGAIDADWYASNTCQLRVRNISGFNDNQTYQINLTDKWQRIEQDFPASTDGNKGVIFFSPDDDHGGVFLIAAVQLERKYNSLYGGNNKAGLWFATPYDSAVPSTLTVKNLISEENFPGTLNGVAYNKSGHFDFEGTDDNIQLTSAFPTGNTSWTWSAWIKPHYSTDGTILFAGTESAGQAMVSFCQDGAVRVGIWGTDYTTAGTAIADDTWGMTTWVYSEPEGTLKCYTNGQIDGTSNSVNFNVTGTSVRIGSALTTNYFGGGIAQVQIYNKALTVTEVEQIYNATAIDFNRTDPYVAVTNAAYTPPVGGGDLYPFTSAYFTVSQALTDDTTSEEHRFGPSQAEVRGWLSGTANGGGGHTWADTYVDCPQDGYQRWRVPKTGKYTITAKGGGAGRCQQNYIGRGVKVIADFNLTKGDYLILAAGQGVPDDFNSDSCNGGGGASAIVIKSM